ncbi:MAG: histidinol-phosphate transaminase [Sulfurospirillum sp.]|nr:histidinol-phosphate transaminase [Sulfurospirillum sp.]
MIFNKTLDNLKTYTPGKPIELVVREYGLNTKDIIKLASNENPRGCSPRVIEVLKESMKKINLYPDDSMYELKDSLANKFKVEKENIIIGAGSDQIISLALQAKANTHSSVLMAGVTFAMYEIYSKQVGAKILKTKSSSHNLDQFLDMCHKNSDVSVLFLCLPNNPLGECLDIEDVYSFLKKIDSNILVVIDGAYQEYAKVKDKNKKITPKNLIEKFPNVLYLGTFSKVYGLAGMRCGYGVANKKIIKALNKIRSPFNVTTLSLKACVEALKDEEFVSKSVEENFLEMSRYEDFISQNGFDSITSYANFIIIKYDKNKKSKVIAHNLLKKGIIVRDLGAYNMNAIRVTIGTPKQNSKFFNR